MYSSASAKARKAFKPPSRSGQPSSSTSLQPSETIGKKQSVQPPEPEDDIQTLRAREAQMDAEIKKLEAKGCKPEQYQEYINLLHKYNEIKDIAQMFMGRLAVYECVTNREIARRYDAPELD